MGMFTIFIKNSSARKMLFNCGFKNIKTTAVAILFLLLTPAKLLSQAGILDSVFTFREGTIRTGQALDIISGKTNYNFTYDSRLINTDRKTELDFSRTSLREILKRILQNDSLVFSVIDRYIIISRPEKPSTVISDSITSAPGAISGRIIDEDTGDALPFATIGFKSVPKGTVTNNNGEFRLIITPDVYYDTLSVSYLGYFRRQIPVKKAAGTSMVITMEREYIPIPEIIIKNQIPQEIISKMRRAIPANYGETPAMMTGFYREGILRKNDLQTYSEAVINIFKSSYTSTLSGDQIKIFKSRKIENLNESDTLAVRLKAGLSTCLQLDIIKNIADFLSVETMKDYNYRLTDIVKYDNESAYAIEFNQKETSEIPLYKGTVFINTSDFGVYNAEFEINPAQIENLKSSFITSSSKNFTTWPLSVKYYVSYRKVNGRYFLSHVRGDLLFASRQRNRLFKTQFRVFFELAITETSLKNVKRFDREELAPVHSIFSETINSYDSEFWGNQDFLKPEDNLIEALKKMKVRLQEFSQ
jgi:hypothetical protein